MNPFMTRAKTMPRMTVTTKTTFLKTLTMKKIGRMMTRNTMMMMNTMKTTATILRHQTAMKRIATQQNWKPCSRNTPMK